MKMLCSVQLSKHRYKTPEGYLVCKDCIIARTGKQTYLKAEIGRDDGSDEEYIDIDRKPNEVFSEKTLASFEGKPLTIEHPNESVSPDNYKELSVGNVHNVRRGKFEGQDVMYADINVYDAQAISLIESGEMVELSCGYDCDITEGPNPEQVNIRGNHVALCEQGRAGIARIQDSWGAQPVAVKDAVGRGTLIQEFGRYGEQYKIVKIDGNVMYCEEIVTKKNTLFKRDKENVDWAVINKKQLNDALIVETWDIILETDKGWHCVLNKVENYIHDHYGYSIGEVKEKVEKGERMLQCIPLAYVNVGESQISKMSIGPFNSEEDAKEFYAKELKEVIAKYKIDKDEHITVIYNKEVHKLGDAEEKIRPNDFSTEFTRKELDEFIKNLYADDSTDSVTSTGKKDPERKKKIFIDYDEKEKFLASLPEEAQAMADEFDHTWTDEDGDPERWLVYWEVYYYDTKSKETKDANSFLKWVEENYHITPEEYDQLTDLEKREVIKEYKLSILEKDETQDSFGPLFVIGLPGGAWLGEDDRPTQEQEKAKKFGSEEEADEYRKVFCNGKVVKIHEPKVVADSLNISAEKENIKNILNEKNIKYTDIGDSWGSITIDFDDRRELRKGGKALVRLYDIELFENGDDGLYIAVYDKFPEESDIELADSAWSGYNLVKGKPAQDFKQYLRDRGMEFEPSENGEFVHFEVKNADEDVDKEIKAIIDHYTKTGFLDSYSKRFYINAIKSLKEKLSKLEKNELLDANQKDYESQKAQMKKTIEAQIEEYEKKLDAID